MGYSDDTLVNGDKTVAFYKEQKERAQSEIDYIEDKIANYKEPFDAYQSLAGEIEARNAQARMNMSDEERAATSPESTQDIKNADAIVVFDDGTMMAYEPEAMQTQEGNTQIEVTGQEIGDFTDTNDLRRKAYKFFKDNLQGKYAEHPVLGKIKFIRRGIDKVKSTSADIDKLKLVPKIKEIIETSQYLRSEDANKPREDNIVKFHYLSNNITFEGKPLNVFVSIAEDNEGNFFYNINKDKNQPSQDNAVQMRSGEGRKVDNSTVNLNITPSAEDVNENNTFYQSAFHGTPHPELEGGHFSLEKVGSGEGGAAHGYGAVYAALKYDVAEGYRKRLSEGKSKLVIGDKSVEDWINSYDWNNEDMNIPDNLVYDIKRYIENSGVLRKRDTTEAKSIVMMNLGYYIQDLKTDLQKEDVDEVYLKHTQEDLDNLSDLRDKLATYTWQEYSLDAQTGQTYEVDIPENPYLMDEDEEFVRQPEIVRNALREIVNELTDEQISKEFAGTTYPENRDALRRMWKDGDYDFNNDGRDIYRSLTTMLGSKKAASQMLEKHGVKGITYEGAQDGRCFVIFNPKDVKVIQKFYQQEANRSNSFLGAYSNRIIYLNKNANASTLPHELAHFWSDELKQSKSLRAMELLKQADQWEEKEFERKYQVVKQGDKYIVADKAGKSVYDNQGNGFATEEKAKAYAKEELFAQGFEQYLRSGGKAPSKYRI